MSSRCRLAALHAAWIFAQSAGVTRSAHHLKPESPLPAPLPAPRAGREALMLRGAISRRQTVAARRPAPEATHKRAGSGGGPNAFASVVANSRARASILRF